MKPLPALAVALATSSLALTGASGLSLPFNTASVAATPEYQSDGQPLVSRRPATQAAPTAARATAAACATGMTKRPRATATYLGGVAVPTHRREMVF